MGCLLVAFKCIPVFFLFSFTNAQIPNYIKVCKSNDPNIAECIKNAVTELRSKLKEGIPEMNVPSLEPLKLDEIRLRTGPSSAKINANITNIEVWGSSDYIITDMKVDLQKKRFISRFNIPQLYFEGDYDLDMHVLLLDLRGKGRMHGNLTNYQGDILMKGRKINRNGKQYLKFDKMKVLVKIGNSRIILTDLFNDNPVLGRATNDVIADNTDIFLNEIKPSLEDALAEKFTEISNKITLTFTYDELFPSN